MSIVISFDIDVIPIGREPISTTQLLKNVAIAYGRGPLLLPVPKVLLQWLARFMGKANASDKLLVSLVVSDQKTRNLLGWVPPIDMLEQLHRMRAVLKK